MIVFRKMLLCIALIASGWVLHAAVAPDKIIYIPKEREEIKIVGLVTDSKTLLITDREGNEKTSISFNGNETIIKIVRWQVKY